MYTREWGSADKPIPKPAAGGYAIHRLGTLSLPLTAGASTRWTLNVDYTWATSPSGLLAMDWLMLVPAGQRVCSPTGENLDSSFPRFMPNNTSQHTKTVFTDGSGTLTTASVTAADSGLGGAALELPPGTVDMAVLLSDTPVDEPAGGSSSNSEEWTVTTGVVTTIPRYYLVRSS